MATDTEMLDWLTDRSNLHSTVEILYIPGGYQVYILDSSNGTETGPYFDSSLRGALRLAMAAQP